MSIHEPRCSSAVTQPASLLSPRAASLPRQPTSFTSRCCPSAVRQQASPSLLSCRRDREPASLLSTRPVLPSRPHFSPHLLTHSGKTTTRGKRRTVSWLTAAGEQRGDKGGLLVGSRQQENNAGEKGDCFVAHGSRRTTRGQRRLAGRLTAAGEQRGGERRLFCGSWQQENNAGTKEACWQAHGGRRTADGLSSQQIMHES